MCYQQLAELDKDCLDLPSPQVSHGERDGQRGKPADLTRRFGVAGRHLGPARFGVNGQWLWILGGIGVKRLILLRHAKSSWDRPDLPDAARPLSKRGERTAPLIGQLMAREGLVPDRILCSTARRAVQTAKRVVHAFPGESEIEEVDSLYMATPREILSVLGDHGGHENSILVIGHNPGLGDLAAWLVSEGDTRETRRLKDKFPTAALAVIDLPIENWHDLADTVVDSWGGRLVRFAVPRDLETEEPN